MNFITIIAIALASFIGGFTASMEESSTQAPTQAISQAPSQAYTYDAPSDWVCATGSTIECSDVLHTDAAQTLVDHDVQPDPRVADTMAIKYLGTADRITAPYSAFEFSFESFDFPGTYHLYAYVGAATV